MPTFFFVFIDFIFFYTLFYPLPTLFSSFISFAWYRSPFSRCFSSAPLQAKIGAKFPLAAGPICCLLLACCLSHSLTLDMEIVCPPEMSVTFYQTTQKHTLTCLLHSSASFLAIPGRGRRFKGAALSSFGVAGQSGTGSYTCSMGQTYVHNCAAAGWKLQGF
jgi:hypothetical protein